MPETDAYRIHTKDSEGAGGGVCSGASPWRRGQAAGSCELPLCSQRQLSQSSSDVSPGSGKIRHLEESAEFQTKKLVTVIVILVGSLSPLSLILVDLDLQLAVERSRGHLR